MPPLHPNAAICAELVFQSGSIVIEVALYIRTTPQTPYKLVVLPTSACCRHSVGMTATGEALEATSSSAPSELLVQPARLEHLDDLVANNIAMAKETEDLDLPMDRIHKGVEAVLKQQHLGAYYVILQDSQVIAQLMITYEWSDWRNATVWWIQSVYVRPPYRRRGCFRRLYQHVRAAAAAAGAGGLRLYADDDNSSAHATYTHLGMTSHYKVFEDMFTGY